jgi:hypothetical protein
MACGGGGEKVAPTPTPIDRPTLEAMLHSIAFKLEDLPAGFTVTSEVITNNEEAAATDAEGPTKAKARLDGWHRFLGEVTTYTSNDQYGAFVNGGLATITANINIFGDEQGAADSIQWGRELFNDPPRAATLTPGVSEMQGGPMSYPTIGDETIAAEFTGLFHDPQYNLDVPFTAHVVTVRQGKGVAYIIVSAIGGTKPGPEVERMIRLLDERLAQTVH